MRDEPLKILVVDDDPALLTVLEAGLAVLPGVRVTALVKAADALATLQREMFDLLIADFSLADPNINGLTLLGMAQQQPRKPLTIIITAYASLQITLQSIQLGAYDFLTKPFQIEELQLVVRNAAELLRLQRENDSLREQLGIMVEAIMRLEHDHAEVADRVKQLSNGIDPSGTDPGIAGVTTGLDAPAIHEMRRRRLREQVNSYQRMSETLGEQLSRERQRIQSLVDVGLIPEGTYQRAVREGRFGGPEPPIVTTHSTEG